MRTAALAGGHAADHPGAIRHRLFGMVGAFTACKTLADYFGIFVDKYTHDYAAFFFTAPTIFSAASARLSAEVIARPLDSSIFCPSSTLVPSSRTTSGMDRCTSFAAEMI